MHVIDSPLTYLRHLGPRFLLAGFSCPLVAADTLPGQFVQIRFTSSKSILLPRAFSVLAAGPLCDDPDRADLEILVHVVGEATRTLADMSPGQTLQITGPTGSAFRIPDTTRRLIAVAGGVGVAPLHLLAAHLARTRPDLPVDFLYGARTARDLPVRPLLEKLPANLVCVTDDGSCGHAGLVTDALLDILGDNPPPDTLLCACGPAPMLRALQRIVRDRNLPCFFSLENYMACGTGVCQGCVVNVGPEDTPAYRRVCVDGPVFDAHTVSIVDLAAKP